MENSMEVRMEERSHTWAVGLQHPGAPVTASSPHPKNELRV